MSTAASTRWASRSATAEADAGVAPGGPLRARDAARGRAAANSDAAAGRSADAGAGLAHHQPAEPGSPLIGPTIREVTQPP